jgi:cAMP-binding proteins - catabolite gene activator and regulatory subunit of cAMP-dependent protein kinases
MEQLLKQAELFEGLREEDLSRLTAIGRRQALRAGEYLILLGGDALDFYVVTKGKLELCFPMPIGADVRDIAVESIGPGKALGWSALVRPYRFTLSARAVEPSEVVAFARRALIDVFEREPRLGYTFFMKISELIGIRLETFQALWVRELRRLAERPSEWPRGAEASRGRQ